VWTTRRGPFTITVLCTTTGGGVRYTTEAGVTTTGGGVTNTGAAWYTTGGGAG
jgi:hypothetical protein